MSTSWNIKSIAPHDFFLCLDMDMYFDHEHDIQSIPEKGFIRPLKLSDGSDILTTIFFNGDPEEPIFSIQTDADLSKDEQEFVNGQLDRILGLSIDLNPLLEQASDDEVIGPLLTQLYGFKRLARASFFEDAMNRMIQTQISHKPTAKKMVYGVREAHGTLLPHGDELIASWPSPHQLMSVDPMNLKKHGLSLRKGEYVVGLSNLIVSGDFDVSDIDTIPGDEFYKKITKIRGIGPTSAQDLMLYRKLSSAVFPSNKQKNEEKGLRRWIAYSYGTDANEISEEEFAHLIRKWKGYEATALEYLHMNYVLSWKKKKK